MPALVIDTGKHTATRGSTVRIAQQLTAAGSRQSGHPGCGTKAFRTTAGVGRWWT